MQLKLRLFDKKNHVMMDSIKKMSESSTSSLNLYGLAKIVPQLCEISI